MQKYRQVILFTLFITICYAKPTINSLDTHTDLGSLGDHSTIFAYSIQLWATVTECPKPCSCGVTTNKTEDEPRSLTFSSGKPESGYVTIEDLQPNTVYSFTLKCEVAGEPAVYMITRRTDYGRPSPPQNINASLVSDHIKITWAIPQSPAGPINNYKLTIVDKIDVENISANEYSYEMTEKYVYGTKYIFKLVACNKNKQGDLVCSNQNGLPEVSFFEPATTATTQPSTTITITTTQTTTKSSGVHSYSLSVLLIIFSLFFLQ